MRSCLVRTSDTPEHHCGYQSSPTTELKNRLIRWPWVCMYKIAVIASISGLLVLFFHPFSFPSTLYVLSCSTYISYRISYMIVLKTECGYIIDYICIHRLMKWEEWLTKETQNWKRKKNNKKMKNTLNEIFHKYKKYNKDSNIRTISLWRDLKKMKIYWKIMFAMSENRDERLTKTKIWTKYHR